jgi:hypothetical protein
LDPHQPLNDHGRFRAAFFPLGFLHIRRLIKGLADLADCPGYFKVQAVMQCATRIEARPTRRTRRLTIQVLTDGQLSAARAAQHRLLIELSLRPNPRGMIGFQFVAVEAAIIGPAAAEFYRDDIELAAIVRATRARIYVHPSYRNSRNRKLHVRLLKSLCTTARLTHPGPALIPLSRPVLDRRRAVRLPHAMGKMPALSVARAFSDIR